MQRTIYHLLLFSLLSVGVLPSCSESQSARLDGTALEDALVKTLLEDYCGDAFYDALIFQVAYPGSVQSGRMFERNAESSRSWIREEKKEIAEMPLDEALERWKAARATQPFSHIRVRFAYRVRENLVDVLMENQTDAQNRLGSEMVFQWNGSVLDLQTNQRVWLK